MRHSVPWLPAAISAITVAAVGLLVITATQSASATNVGALAASAGCGRAPTLRSGTHTIQSSGKSRSFILRIPDGYNNTSQYRLIFGYHWRGGTMNDVASGGSSGAAWAYYGMQQQSNNSAILVAPQGLGNGWANTNGEDVTFTDDMIRRDRERPLRRHHTAVRHGLQLRRRDELRHRLCPGHRLPGRRGLRGRADQSGCSGGSQPIAYFGIHGISDNVLNISQGRSLRDRFVRNNGCAAQNPPEPAPGSGRHITTTYSCRAGFPVQWAAFDGGHGPGPVDGCSGCEDGVRTWTKGEAWRFISQFGSTPPSHRRRPARRRAARRRARRTSRSWVGQSGRCVDVPGCQHRQRCSGAVVGLPRRCQPALDATPPAGS